MLVIVPAASADVSQDIRDMFKDTQFINSVYELPEAVGTPAVIWQKSNGNLEAWLDIVGYRHLSQDNGTFYTLEDPTKEAIIKYDTRAVFDCRYSACMVESITPILTVTLMDNLTTARLHVDMKYLEIYCTQDGCQTHHLTEQADFYDSELAPERFIMPGAQDVNIKQYNGSVYKPQVLNFNLSPGITALNITTINGSIKQYFKAGQVAYTDKNIPYLNLTKTDQYEQTGRDISKLNNEYIVNSNLTGIEFFTAYGPLEAGANIIKTLMPETKIQSGVYGIIYIVFIFFGGIYVMFKTAF
jgi:hypothetical protein